MKYLVLIICLCSQVRGADLYRSLLAAAKDGDHDLVCNLLSKAGTDPSEKVIKLAISIGIQTDFPQVYQCVRRALGKIRSEDSVKSLGKIAAKSKDLRSRILAIFALSDITLPSTIDHLIPLLKSKESRIAIEAVRMLETKPDKRVIQGLIESLSSADRNMGELSRALRLTLFRLTGKSFAGLSDWTKWWKIEKDQWVPPAEQKIKGRTALAKVNLPGEFPRFFGMEIVSLRVVFIIDVSGSMRQEEPDTGQSRIDLVKGELNKAIKELRAKTFFSTIAFSSVIIPWDKKLLPASARNKVKAMSFVDRFQASGATWTKEALEKAFSYKHANTFVLLSDGAPAKAGQEVSTKEIIEWVTHTNRFRKATIHTIGFSGANIPFMKELAEKNNGTYREIK